MEKLLHINSEFSNLLFNNKHIFNEIYKECNSSFEKGCGSYLFDGQTYDYCDLMYEKQNLLFNSVKNVSSVLEIGTYMGHSLLIMLLSNPQLKITCIDISDKYAGPAVNILNKYFNNAITFINNDSITALQTLLSLNNQYDFFHIDGLHEETHIVGEFNLIKQVNQTNNNNVIKIIFDDQDCLHNLQKYIIEKYKINTIIKTNCPWSNVYFEIQL